MEAPEGTEEGGIFWRWVPARTAAAFPRLNALYVRDFVPKIGGDFGRAVDEPGLWDLVSHELGHGLHGLTTTGRLLRRLHHATYLLLYDLDDPLILRVPSWELDGNHRLAPLAPKLRALLVALDAQAGFVDEAICTLYTLLARRRLVLTGQWSDGQYAEGRAEIRRLSDRQVWHLCEQFVGGEDAAGMRWLQTEDLSELGWASMLVMDIGSYALGPGPDALRGWWQTGRAPRPGSLDHPQTRLDRAVHLVEAAATVDEAAERLATVSPSVLTWGLRGGRGIEWMLRATAAAGAGDEPDPYADVAEALGIDADALTYHHPIGRALAYLETGYTERRDEERRWGRDDCMVMPIVTRDRGHFACRFEVRSPFSPLEDLLAAGLGGRSSAGRSAPRRGKNVVHLGPMTLLPASKEATLLWHLDRIAGDLLTTGRLQCLCGAPGRTASGCAGATLLSRVCQRTVTDTGRPSPPPRCLLA